MYGRKINLLERKKYQMREYRKRQYVIKKFNIKELNGIDYTELTTAYYKYKPLFDENFNDDPNDIDYDELTSDYYKENPLLNENFNENINDPNDIDYAEFITAYYKHKPLFKELCGSTRKKIERKIKKLENEYVKILLKQYEKEKIEFVIKRVNKYLENDYTEFVISYYTEKLKSYDLPNNDKKEFKEMIIKYEQEFIEKVVFLKNKFLPYATARFSLKQASEFLELLNEK
jgi:hypothetical protein